MAKSSARKTNPSPKAPPGRPQTPPRRAVWGWAILALLLLGIASLGTEPAYVIAWPGAFIALYLSVVTLIWLATRQIVRGRGFARLAIAAVFAFGAPVACTILEHGVDKLLAPTVAAIERYYDQNKRYPEALEALVPALLPVRPSCRWEPAKYFRHEDPGLPPWYEVGCDTWDTHARVYDSRVRAWVSRD